MLTATFDIENKRFKTRKTATATTVTIVVHALLLLFLLFYVLTPPDPPYVDLGGGLEVNFGSSDVGSGDVQPTTLTPIAADFKPAPEQSKAATQPVTKQNDIATQDLEDAPEMNSSKTPSPKPTVDDNALFKPNKNPTTAENVTKTTNTKAEEVHPKVDNNALFPSGGAKGNPNNSKGDGEGKGQGDQGKPDGDPNSKNYKGNGHGNGTGDGTGDGASNVKLSGRRTLIRVKPNDNSQAKGRVVITIKVDKTGKVIDARYTQLGSTTIDDNLVNASIEAAKKYRFDNNPDAADVQTGTITFIYKF